jgi:hypothetical protein
MKYIVIFLFVVFLSACQFLSTVPVVTDLNVSIEVSDKFAIEYSECIGCSPEYNWKANIEDTSIVRLVNKDPGGNECVFIFCGVGGRRQVSFEFIGVKPGQTSITFISGSDGEVYYVSVR